MRYVGYRFRLILLGVALAVALPATAVAGSGDKVVILLNARNPTAKLTKAQIQNFFLGATAFWHGVVPAKVIVRPATGEAGKAFYGPVLGRSAQGFAKHWDKLQLSGRAVAPTTARTVQDVAKAVAGSPGAISFALASEAWQLSGIKVVELE